MKNRPNSMNNEAKVMNIGLKVCGKSPVDLNLMKNRPNSMNNALNSNTGEAI
ncbi:hypothetical protein JSY36_14395 [Bacillus sp. H-16]|uniref:hypothetical protein n=1 Tax=Alteribacter salitolerans TaxID=2912333 RepID=UPI0019648C7A|nr:hypothetical protein [Alteribacter salitolerans]MBM7096923.1 hypothetical protein [Alteribacter salitolerans]